MAGFVGYGHMTIWSECHTYTHTTHTHTNKQTCTYKL